MALEFVEAAAGWARRFNQAARTIEEIVVVDENNGGLVSVRCKPLTKIPTRKVRNSAAWRAAYCQEVGHGRDPRTRQRRRGFQTEMNTNANASPVDGRTMLGLGSIQSVGRGVHREGRVRERGFLYRRRPCTSGEFPRCLSPSVPS